MDTAMVRIIKKKRMRSITGMAMGMVPTSTIRNTITLMCMQTMQTMQAMTTTDTANTAALITTCGGF